MLFIVSVIVPVAQGKVSATVPGSGGFAEHAGGGILYINGTVDVNNQGIYSIYGLLYNAEILSSSNANLYNYTGTLPSIPPGRELGLNVSIPVPFSALQALYSQTGPSGTTNVTISITLSGRYALGAISFRVVLTTGIQITPSALASAAGGMRWMWW